MSSQIYEDYWKYTAAYTNFNSAEFIGTLKECFEILRETHQTERKYKVLQQRINKVFPKNPASIRKAINQIVKLGFINPDLSSCHYLTKSFLQAADDKGRQHILSQVVYSNSGFNKSATKADNNRHIKFLVNSLIHHGSLSREDIGAIITIDIAHYPGAFVNSEDLRHYRSRNDMTGFVQRKYNQISHLISLLDKLEDLSYVKKDERLYFTKDVEEIIEESDSRKRDPYLHRLYKNKLVAESEITYGSARCMVENLPYPVLIASHIKPFVQCTENEAYDPNNGLLLSRTLDSLFDLFYVSFDDNGCIIFSDRLNEDVIESLSHCKIEPEFLTDPRRDYLEYHRNEMFLR